MLNRVTIKNFRCLKHVEVDLRPLTVLIGPNDSGKSAFLGALLRLAQDQQPVLEDFWRLNQENAIDLSAQTAHGSVGYSLGERNQYRRIVRASGGARDEELTKQTVFFQLPAAGVPMTSPGHPDQGDPPKLDPEAKQVPALLDYVLRRDRKQFEAFVESMRKHVPGLEDVKIASPDPKVRRIDLAIEDGLVIPGEKASAGVRLLLFFVALTYHPVPPNVILLEEPENGLHPRRLADIMKLLRDVTAGIHCGKPAQVILTTHSPHLLDHVDLEQDRVLVFRRQDDGSRIAEPVDKDRLKEFLDEFMLGEVWFNEEEDGLVGQKK